MKVCQRRYYKQCCDRKEQVSSVHIVQKYPALYEHTPYKININLISYFKGSDNSFMCA